MYGLPQYGILAQKLLKENLNKNGIQKVNLPPVSGRTNCDQLHSLFMWKTLESGMLEKSTRNTSCLSSKKTTKYQLIGQEAGTWD